MRHLYRVLFLCEHWSGSGYGISGEKFYDGTEKGFYYVDIEAYSAADAWTIMQVKHDKHTFFKVFDLISLADTADICSQCGQPYNYPACGPTHAMVQKEKNI